jgi:HSP20 family protein
VERLRDNVMGVFDRWLPQRHEGVHDEGSWPLSLFTHRGPAVEMSDDDDAIRVTAELPGLNKRDFQVDLYEDRLVLRGEKKAQRETKEAGHHLTECSYGSFARSIPIHTEIERDKVTAEYKHGVLHVTLPKTEAARAKRIKVDIK